MLSGMVGIGVYEIGSWFLIDLGWGYNGGGVIVSGLVLEFP